MSNVLDVRRRELKYRMSLDTSLKAQHDLSHILPSDAHGGRDGYIVRSLYFDSLWNSDLEDKEDGLEKRKKVRLRVYSPSDTTAKLELKEKAGVWQHKQSLLLQRKDALLLATGDYSPLAEMEQTLAQKLYRLMSERLYLPRCVVEYRRYALVVPANDIRITFDRYLAASEGCLELYGKTASLYPVGWPDDVTMEVKYHNFLFSYVKDLLDGVEKVPVTYSKYVMSRFVSHIIG